MAKAPEELAHLEWLGYVQPIGLVVSVPAMLEAQCYVNKNISGEHARFLNCLPRDKKDNIVPEITDFAAFARKCLEWDDDDLKEIPQRAPLPEELSSLEVILPQYHETLRPTHAVPVFKPKQGEIPWQTLILTLPSGTDFDEPSEADSSRHWHAAPQLKFERLLREAQVPIGLLCNGRQLRLVYAPRGESSGYATFNVDEMVQVAGRPMFAALHMLLSSDRMFTLPDKQRLPSILENSRKYQNTVSTKLAEQVLAALYELMRGFQAANDVRNGELLREILANDPNQVYSGLLTVLMRLVFVLYAEDRDLMSSDAVYSNNYSVTGLFERLRQDRGRFPDTMDQRFGSWSQLLTLFRLVFEGGQHDTFKLPARKGYLFDPDRYPFLEGRSEKCSEGESAPIPRISDGVVYRVLRNLLILDGERLSYRTLDVEQIGSVYETMMGFDLHTAEGKSIAIKPVKTHGAPATINLDALLQTKGKDRAKWIKDQTDQNITGEALKALKEANSIDDLLAALDKKIAKKVTPRVVSTGAIILQPSDERRRSGSHYTPRSLTKPIVEKTLEPILKQLVEPPHEVAKGEKTLLDTKGRKTQAQVIKSERDEEAARLAQAKGSPHPRQILNLKVCDPAMGSGAFLVETCRQLGEELVKAWYAHDCVPTADIPPDEDEVLYARRLIAQRCLYGVDKNPMAADLSKLSLWLATLAKDHPFTFLDHSLRHGDSLVGLTAEQIAAFTWDLKPGEKKRGDGITFMSQIQARLEKATDYRRKILDAREDAPYRDQEQRMALADEALSLPRLIGDACISAFFSEAKTKAREASRDRLFARLTEWLQSGDMAKRQPIVDTVTRLRTGERPVPPFHWVIEFPEVFGRENGGFDAFVGNPPFLGGTMISTANSEAYKTWLYESYPESGNRMDLVAYFFRRTFQLLRLESTVGLIATKTIAEGDTRKGGLRFICEHGGQIYSATRRTKWPGEAAVIVSVIHIAKHLRACECVLDGKPVQTITAFLFHQGNNDDPKPLRANHLTAFEGSKPYGQGFIFDDNDPKSTPISVMRSLLKSNPNNADRIRPYLAGEEVNDSPTHNHRRYIINFGELSLDQVSEWPDLLAIVIDKVKSERLSKSAEVRKRPWWQFFRVRSEMYDRIRHLPRVLVCSRHQQYWAVTFCSGDIVYSEALVVFAFDSFSSFALLQSRAHEVWARFFASSLEDRLRYTPSDCFETFPFPREWEQSRALEDCGRMYSKERANIMMKSDEGLTKTYGRFHDPHDNSPEIQMLRELHYEMDRAVLGAYGWNDLVETATCEFLLDYIEDEDDNHSAKESKKKKPWRYRWPDEFRDEVLARLLELNQQRAMEEKLAGKLAAKADEAKTATRKTTKPRKPGRKEAAAKGGLYQQEMERFHRYVLLLLRAWGGKPLTRRALNAGMILMLDDKLRIALLDNKTTVPRHQVSEGELNQIVTELSIDGFVKIDTSGNQQILSVSPTAPSTDDASEDELKRIREVKEYFRREADAGKVTESEESVDAELDLVPAG